MLNSKPIEKVLFLDIETVPQEESFMKLSKKKQELFVERFKTDVSPLSELPAKEKKEKIEEVYNLRGSLHPEFGKIACISVGVINPTNYSIKTKSFAGNDEMALLTAFLNEVNAVKNFESAPSKAKDNFSFCAHNGKVFDFPFVAKRIVLNGLQLPECFDIAEKKPWDLVHLIDTKEVWKFGVYDGNCSLDLLADIFGVESSKEEMSGKDVKDVFYKEKDMAKISKYCEKDVVALATIYLRMKGIKNQLIK